MAYLGVLEAVRARLEGKSAFFIPTLPSLMGADDQRLDIISASASLGRGSKTDLGGLEVPIYFFDKGGADNAAVYPSLTFEIIDMQPRDKAGEGNWNPVRPEMRYVDLPGQRTVPVDGLELTGPYQSRKRATEEPWDIMFEVRAYADDPILSALLVSDIQAKFPRRHFIRVPLFDGSFASWNLSLQSYRDLDKREAVRAGSPGTEREYAKVFTYVVEGYLDTTDKAILVNLVQRRNLNLSGYNPGG